MMMVRLHSARCVEVVLFLHLLEVSFLLLRVHLLERLVSLVVQNHQVPSNGSI